MGKPARAYIVDDEDMILSICQEALSDTFSVEGFTSPIKALEAVDAGDKPDVVVTDIRMPDMSGVDFLKALKARGHTMPVIIITGYADRDAAVQSLNLGAFAMIDKPFNVSTLMLTVNRAAAFKLMQEQSAELLPQYMFLADALNELLNGHSDNMGQIANLLASASVPTDLQEKILTLADSSGMKKLKQTLANHEEKVSALHMQEEKLRLLLAMLENKKDR